MLSVTDAEGNTTNYEYDSLNRLTKQIYPNNQEVTYTYDKNSNLVTKTDPNGTQITNTYDNMDRLTAKTINRGTGVLGTTTESYTYDSLGRLVQTTDSNNHELEFSYDSLNRLTSETQSGSTITYTYDDNNNLLSITNPENNTTNYTYDELNRISQIKQNTDIISTYTYTGLENTNIAYGNNTNITKTYDDLSRLQTLNNGVKDYTYTYDDVSNITSDNYKDYTYDDIYRLTQTTDTNTIQTLEDFSYDKVGNRETSYNSKVGSGANYEYTKNSLNQYTTLSGSISKYVIEEIIEEIETGSGSESGTGETNSGTTNTGSTSTGTTITYSGGLVNIDDSNTFTYDNNGNITSNGTYDFIYDYKNRIVKVTDNNSNIIVEYFYDVLDRRYGKSVRRGETEDIQKIEYFYSNENILVESITESGSTIEKEYINGLGTDDLIAYDLDNVRYYFSKNHLGSIDGISDDSGVIVVSYEYDSYGNFTLSGSDIRNTRLFTGREYDEEIGLYYMRARYYDPSLGRFISRDPIDIADDINLYSYVGNNPIMFVDLMGKAKQIISMSVDLFNSSGKKMKSHNNFAHGPVDVFGVPFVGATFLAKGTYFSNTNDLSVTRNTQYLIETSLTSNIKERKDFMQYSDNYNECANNDNIGCYFTDNRIDSDLNPIYLADVGNILAGYNAQKIGLSYDYIEETFWSLSEKTASDNYGKGTKKYNDYLDDERIDQIAYKAGYELGNNSKIGGLSEQQFTDVLTNVMSKINSQRYK